jgi:hypothetical protein
MAGPTIHQKPLQDMGHAGTGLVSAGARGVSKEHELLFSVVPEAPSGLVMQSTKYRLKSGVIAATGSQK